MPIQLAMTIKMKIVNTNGKNFLAFSLPARLSQSERKNSTIISKRDCNLPGTSFIPDLIANANKTKTNIASHVVIIVFIKYHLPITGISNPVVTTFSAGN